MGDFATITSKGQLTVPKPVRDRHNLQPGDTVEFREEGGRLWVEGKPPRAVDLMGILGKPSTCEMLTGEALDAAIEEAFAEAVAEDDASIMREWHEGRE